MKKDKRTRRELINLILNDYTSKQEDEETLHLLLKEKLSTNINSLRNENLSIGNKLADAIAKFAGSWAFILIFISCLLLWVASNALMLTWAFDPYPFILLNLMLSCIAAVQAPVIMMSQNREEEKDRLRAQNDYKINLKSEIIIEDLHQKLDLLIENQQIMMEKINKLEDLHSEQKQSEK